MKRALFVAGLILLAVAGLLEAQTTSIDDREVQRFVLPGTNTTGMRVHTSAAHMSLTLIGQIAAGGGYKVSFAYAHGENIVQSTTNAVMPIAGTTRSQDSGSGVSYQRIPYAGSIIGISIGASTALTAGSATAEATIFRSNMVIATGLTATIASSGDLQYATVAQARGLDGFTPAEAIGCRLTTSADLAPRTAEMVCSVIVEF